MLGSSLRSDKARAGGTEVPSFKPRIGKSKQFTIYDLLFGICLKIRIWDFGILKWIPCCLPSKQTLGDKGENYEY
jgi:hypothetical protein